MYIDLNKVCIDFINKKVEINDIIKKYNVNYFKLVKYIKKYCFENGILVNEEIIHRLEIPIKQMIDLRRQGASYWDIAEKYNYSISVTTITNKLKEYCEENHLEFPEKSSKINLPMKEIYELKKEGMTYEKLAKEYNYSVTLIRKRMKDYCKKNHFKLPERSPRSKTIELPIEKVYELKKQGMRLRRIAEKYSCSISTIRQRLINYEDELVLRNKYLEILLYDFNKIIDNKSSKEQSISYSDKGKQNITQYIKK